MSYVMLIAINHKHALNTELLKLTKETMHLYIHVISNIYKNIINTHCLQSKTIQHYIHQVKYTSEIHYSGLLFI